MTEERKTVADVTKERMLFELLEQLRATKRMMEMTEKNVLKLRKENFDVDWYLTFSDRMWKEIRECTDHCLRELGKCAERRNNEKKEEEE